MPEYRFKCECGNRVGQWRAMRNAAKPKVCKCGQTMVRDFQAEGRKGGGELPDWNSSNAGVGLDQVQECNEMYADLGVTFDPRTGNAHVPGRNRTRYLKRRGLTELVGAPLSNHHGKRFHVVDGEVVEIPGRPCG